MTGVETVGTTVTSEYSAPAERQEPYRLVRQLGRGGCAEVYLARHPALSRYVAIKRLLPEHIGSHEHLDMLRREADIGALLEHPNVVRVLDLLEGGQPMLVMEYVDGLSAAQLTHVLRDRRSSCPMSASVHIVREILRALEYVHGVADHRGRLGVVHRDVSHANVLVRRDGQVKLADFGVARWRRDEESRGRFIVGKFGYMSPEQARGGDVDARSDLFSVAVVLAELLLWRKLFPGATEEEIRERARRADVSVLREHGRHVPAALRLVLFTALEVDAGRRFASAIEMRHALEDAAERAGLDLGPQTLTALFRGWAP